MPQLDALFDEMLRTNASALHLSVGHPPMLRIEGALLPHGSEVVSLPRMHDLLDELLDARKRKMFRETNDLDFAYGYEDKARFRCNYLRKTTGPGAVFRTIPSEILSAEQLDLPDAVLAMANQLAGLVLVSGPPRSGTSSTLAALLSHINHNRDGHILTIEKPVEFVHRPARCLISHREVGVDSPTFADAMRCARRENADVILVGELCDAETMRMALQLASVGVLVFATIHTNSAQATIDRFIHAFPANEQPSTRRTLAQSLTGIVAQQLLKKADGSGRVAAHEVLVGTEAVTSAIREANTETIPSLIQAGAQEGMRGMDQTLEKLVRDDVITARAGLEKALDKQNFASLSSVKAKFPQESSL